MNANTVLKFAASTAVAALLAALPVTFDSPYGLSTNGPTAATVAADNDQLAADQAALDTATLGGDPTAIADAQAAVDADTAKVAADTTAASDAAAAAAAADAAAAGAATAETDALNAAANKTPVSADTQAALDGLLEGK